MRLRLYAYWRSSSSWRVRIGLGLKGLAHEIVPVNLLAGEQFGEAHLARNPTAQVPVLEIEDGGETRRLVQSIAILEWLEERFPSPPLLPADPWGRARVRALAEHVNSGIQPHQNATVLRRIGELVPGGAKAWAAHWNATGLRALEAAVKDGGAGRFCHGDAPGLADAYLVPQLFSARRFEVDVSQFPMLLRIEEACAALPAFRSAHPDVQPDAPPPERSKP